MPKSEIISDAKRGAHPIRIFRRKARGNTNPRLLLKCGCCPMKFTIYHAEEQLGNSHKDILEIGGVEGTIHQWTHVFEPLLRFQAPKLQVIHDELEVLPPLTIDFRKEKGLLSPSMRISGGKKTKSLVIFYEDPAHGQLLKDVHKDTLEINGVMGTISQWRKIFSPLLGLSFENS